MQREYMWLRNRMFRGGGALFLSLVMGVVGCGEEEVTPSQEPEPEPEACAGELCLGECQSDDECDEGELCESSACVAQTCTPGEVSCADARSVQRCSERGDGYEVKACEGQETCSDGACSLVCPPELEACGSSCVDTSNSPEHCGGCGSACGTLDRATSVCVASACDFFCDEGFADCDRQETNGCETALLEDLENCGGCGVGCEEGERCLEGACGDECGDGQVGPSEECDDGNLSENDGCSPACVVEIFDAEAACAADCAYQGWGADIADCDEDGIVNAEEMLLGSNSCESDTDGDGLSDLEEVQLRTDPALADTDGDGLEDGAELYWGLNPNQPYTYCTTASSGACTVDAECEASEVCQAATCVDVNCTILDGDQEVVNLCNTPMPSSPTYHVSSSNGWTIAVPAGVSAPVDLTLSTATATNLLGATALDDPTREVSGFLLAKAAASTITPLTLIRGVNLTLIAPLHRSVTSAEFVTHHGDMAIVQDEERVTTTPRTVMEVRDQVLARLGGFPGSSVTGLPVPSGSTHTKFRVSISVTVHADPVLGDRQIWAVAVAPESGYQQDGSVANLMDDFTNTTNVGFATTGGSPGCLAWASEESSPEADLYWVVDDSGSMQDNASAVLASASELFSALDQVQLDYRLGVTTTDGMNAGKLVNPSAWFTSQATFQTALNSVIFNGFAEYGLQASQQGLSSMRSTSVPAAERIRPGAEVVTIWFTDEGPQSLKDLGTPGSMAREAAHDQYLQFFEPRTTAFAMVAVHPVCSGDGANGVEGREYQDIAIATGGAYAPLCDPNAPTTGGPSNLTYSEEIVLTAAGASSMYQLTEVPVSSSMRVLVDGVEVPRSRVDGYDYLAEYNALVFFGSHRPMLRDLASGEFGDSVAVMYETHAGAVP